MTSLELWNEDLVLHLSAQSEEIVLFGLMNNFSVWFVWVWLYYLPKVPTINLPNRLWVYKKFIVHHINAFKDCSFLLLLWIILPNNNLFELVFANVAFLLKILKDGLDMWWCIISICNVLDMVMNNYGWWVIMLPYDLKKVCCWSSRTALRQLAHRKVTFES